MRVIVGDTDISGSIASITWSSVDPGGYESANIELGSDIPSTLHNGDPVRIEDNLTTVFYGRLSLPSRQTSKGVSRSSLGCEGIGALLKDQTQRLTLIDNDFRNWRDPSVQGKINARASNYSMNGGQATPDSSGSPSIALETEGSWSSSGKPLIRSLYDIGEGENIGSVDYAWQKGAQPDHTDTNYHWDVTLTADDVTVIGGDSSGELRAAGPGSGELKNTFGDRRYAQLSFWNSTIAVSAGTAGVNYTIYFTRATVFGDQNLPRRGTSSATVSQGFYTSDIARYAIGLVDDVQTGVIEDAPQLIVRQAAYQQGITVEGILEEMISLVGWHYGTWEPPTVFDSVPRVDFRPRPSAATAIAPVEICDEVSLSEHLANLYNEAQISYQDADGTNRVLSVSRDTDSLSSAGSDGGKLTRTVSFNLGLSTPAVANLFAIDVLLLLERQSRAAGYIAISGEVRLPSGGTKPACHLKAGLDRVSIPNLPYRYGLLEGHSNEFRVKRAEHTADKSGRVTTRLELDDGADLIEVLQARLDRDIKAVTG